MPTPDPVDNLIAVKRAACAAIRKEMKASQSKRRKAQWARRLKKESTEIAALVSVRRQLIALRAIKAAARSA